MPAMGTLAGRAGHPPSSRYFPPRKKLAKKAPLYENLDLSVYTVFDILNLFHCCWFLSVDSLRVQALLAQKAEDGKITWVEFTPQFHSHLVKSAVALVPQPNQKVKKVLFVYTLELLNRVSPQAFFDLTKGDWWATTAQKEKKHLACKRNCALRHDHHRLAKEAIEGHPQWQCEVCGCKFTSHKATKQHQCPLAKGVRRGARAELDKGKSVANPVVLKSLVQSGFLAPGTWTETKPSPPKCQNLKRLD
jgi:rubrerythrin